MVKWGAVWFEGPLFEGVIPELINREFEKI
jgi:hypothetical protein